MSKLTENVGNGEYAVHNVRLNDVILKLGKLEDIEQELGIDLVTLFKAFRGFWYNKNGEIKFSCHPIIVDDGIYILEESYPQASGIRLYFKIYFKDYGKTWALTEEELAKGE